MLIKSDQYPLSVWMKIDLHPPEEKIMDVEDFGHWLLQLVLAFSLLDYSW
jgi:hypothetical protein